MFNIAKVASLRESRGTIFPFMDGMSVEELIYHKANYVITFAFRSTMKIYGESVHLDKILQYHIVLTVGERCEHLQTHFKYEL